MKKWKKIPLVLLEEFGMRYDVVIESYNSNVGVGAMGVIKSLE